MTRRVLLTGSNGLIGQKMLALLAGRDDLVLLATSRRPDPHGARGYAFLGGDLADPGFAAALIERFQPTDVVHAAAMTQVDRCEQESEECDRINTTAVAELCRLCRPHGSYILYLSTDFVFDGRDGPYAEDDEPKPVNHYGHSKLAAERIIARSGLQHALMRTMLVYGFAPRVQRSNLVLWVLESLRAGRAIRVVDDQFRCPTFAEDVAAAALTALLGRESGIYHISGAECMSVFELACSVARFFELDEALIQPVRTETLAEPARRPPRTGFVIDKAREHLDFKPRPLRNGLYLLAGQLAQHANPAAGHGP